MGRIIEIMSGASGGPWNMAVDSLLLSMAESGAIRFALRTYTWKPACVSIGRLQDPSREISAGALRAAGVGAVRRPTGGRAVWHENELTYCIAAAPGHPAASGSIEQSLAMTGGMLVEALGSLGVPATLARADRHHLPRGTASNPCFTSHGRMEVIVSGCKVVGNAQARRRGAFLEHGSIIVHNDQVRLADFLPGADAGSRRSVRDVLSSGVRGLGDFIPGITPGDVREPLHSAFARAAGCTPEALEEGDLDASRLGAVRDSLEREALGWE